MIDVFFGTNFAYILKVEREVAPKIKTHLALKSVESPAVAISPRYGRPFGGVSLLAKV
jgi:hypothetical protein